MENAADALKIAFAVFVFVVGLAVLFYMASLCQETARVLITEADKTQYYSYMDSTTDVGDIVDTTTGNRIVKLEDIIPVIYRYTEENYGVTIIDGGQIVARFDLDTETMVNNWLSASDDTKNTFLEYINDNILSDGRGTTLSLSGLETVFNNLYKQNTSGTIRREFYCAWARILKLYCTKNRF